MDPPPSQGIQAWLGCGLDVPGHSGDKQLWGEVLCSGSAGGQPYHPVRRWDAGADEGRAQGGLHCCSLPLVDSLPSHPSLLPPPTPQHHAHPLQF